MSFALNLIACHRCEQRRCNDRGSCLCWQNGATIHANARGGCPAGKFGPGEDAPVPTHAPLPMPAGFDARDYMTDSKGTGPCNC